MRIGDYAVPRHADLMPNRHSVILALLLGLNACSSSTVIDDPSDAFSVDAISADAGYDAAPSPDAAPTSDAGSRDAGSPDAGSPDAGSWDAGPPPVSAMAQCLEAGGSLRIIHTIDNNDTRDHGPILTFDVSRERQIAVSTEDATLKFWTLDAFQGETGLAQLTYGPEVTATSIALDFWDELAVAGDSQGVIAGWSPEVGMEAVLGGTEPGVALVALAVDDERGLLAQADAAGGLIVRPLPGFEGETAQLEGVHVADLAWADGVLFIATSSGIEARDGGLNLIAQVATADPQLDVHADGDVVVAGGAQVRVFDSSLRNLGNEIPTFATLRSVTLIGGHPVGLFGVFGVWATPYVEVQIAGAPGSPGDQRNITFIFESDSDVPRVPVQVVADPQGELLFVAFEDGGIELLSCEN